MSIKAKQVAGVVTLVVAIVVTLSAYHLAEIARLNIVETERRAGMLALTIYNRARDVTPESGVDRREALRADSGLRSILSSTMAFGSSVTSAGIVDAGGTIVAHGFQEREGQTVDEQEDFATLADVGPIERLRAIYSDDRTFEVRQPILAGDEEWSVRIGVSMPLIRTELGPAFATAVGTVIGALIIASIVALLLSQWLLRPIHVIQSGLTRLGRGELDVSLDLPGEEFRDLGSSFEAVSAQLSAVRQKPLPSAGTDLESVMENLEDAVALFSPSGEMIFSNAAMKALLEEHGDSPQIRNVIDQTLAARRSAGPVPIQGRRDPAEQEGEAVAEAPEHLLMAHAIEDNGGRFLGAMLVARNLGYLSHVHSTLNYSRKLAALGRLMAGVAHEVKNPLNAMTIHLELLKQKLEAHQAVLAGAPPPRPVPAQGVDMSKHVNVIAQEIRRLDEVMMGFLKFARPDELKLQPVQLADLITDVVTIVQPEAEKNRVAVRVDCSPALPEINADPGMLKQAILNLALNACQAMSDGGTLKLACRATPRRTVEVDVEDTGVGIPPEHLSRIFDLYFTTKEKGSGIGLSMVYRIVQLHDGEVEVESTPGSGTRFRLIFPQA
jgi:signal transduction histidine kinase